jgi:hypothetical protein
MGPLLEGGRGDLRGQSPFVVRNTFWKVTKSTATPKPQRGSPNIYGIAATESD